MHWLIRAGRGFGKALAVDTAIPTPTGWKPIGEMVAGDELFDEAGRICRVVEAHEPYEADEYCVEFSDGAKLIACGDHQWVTWTHAERKAYLRSPYEADRERFPENWPYWRLKKQVGSRPICANRLDPALADVASGMSFRAAARKHGVCRFTLARHCDGLIDNPPAVRADSPGPRIRTTVEIMNTLTHGERGDLNHCIPVCAPLDLPPSDLPIAPYTLGAWLGDGTSRISEITSADPEILEKIADEGYAIGNSRKAGGRSSTTAIGNCEKVRDAESGRMLPNGSLQTTLRECNLILNKHIPNEYLRSSFAQRLALLRGLMDTDGSAAPSNVEFCTTNGRLANDVMELAISLGQKPRIYAERAKLNGRDCGPRWRVCWRPTINPFSLSRKADACPELGAQGLRNCHRMVTSVTMTGRKSLMRCLTVDSPNSMYLAGRSMIPTHNTKTGAEWVREVKNHVGCIAIVAETAADARDYLIDGDSGILSCSPPWDYPLYEPSKRRLTWNNGAYATFYSGDKPDQIRGGNFGAAWIDELAKYRYAPEVWKQLKYALRKVGTKVRVLITTTPRAIPILREIEKHPRTVVTVGSTFENEANLSEDFLADMLDTFSLTALGRQELYADYIDEAEGALWRRETIDTTRVDAEPHCRQIVVGVDPATTSHRNMTGIVACGKSDSGHGYVLADASGRYTPAQWGQKVADLYRTLDASLVVAEGNQGGDMVREVIRQHDPDIPVAIVHARHSKQARAEPIANLWAAGRLHMVGAFAMLEDQMVTWEPESGMESPDRLDAMVWAFRRLFLGPRKAPPAAAPEVITVS